MHRILAAGALVALLGGTAAAFFHAGGRGTAEGNKSSWSAEGKYGHASASGGGGSWSASTTRRGMPSGGGGSWNASSARGGSASEARRIVERDQLLCGTASGSGRSWQGTTAGGESYSGYHNYHQGSYAAYDGGGGHTTGGSYYSSYHPPTVVRFIMTVAVLIVEDGKLQEQQRLELPWGMVLVQLLDMRRHHLHLLHRLRDRSTRVCPGTVSIDPSFGCTAAMDVP